MSPYSEYSMLGALKTAFASLLVALTGFPSQEAQSGPTAHFVLATEAVRKVQVELGRPIKYCPHSTPEYSLFSPRLEVDTSSGESKVVDTASSANNVEIGVAAIDSLSLWRFSIIAGITQATATYYGGFEAAKALILSQIALVNSRFNNPAVFDGVFQFSVDSIYEFIGNSYNEALKQHPGYDYRLIYDGYANQGGGWFGPPWNSIWGTWSVDYYGGMFGNYSNDAAVHEWGHARGAVDLYAIQAYAANNPVNGQPYYAENSIMNYPYGVRVWDQHSINLINRNADTVWSSVNYIDESFPSSIGISVRDSTGNVKLDEALVKFYPVNWHSYSVNGSPAYTGNSSSNGDYVPVSNPFGAYVTGHPWDIEYPNFLVSSDLNGKTAYAWFPMTRVQNAYFQNPDTTYRLVIAMPIGCCQNQTGNANLSGLVDLSDLVLLVAYLANPPASRPTLPCPAEANVNATGIIDLSDLSLLIAYLTATPRLTLPNCP